MSGKVSLVGAGCGAADLITLRGLNRLQACDVVVYDDLIAPELLDAAPPEAERIYAGKRYGKRALPQEEINRLLIDRASQGMQVVRLKGGDPFVFGRGGEEALALDGTGIPYELVPGISSAIAIPEEAGIPVTHRGMSRSFHVITAQTAQGLCGRWGELAALEGTLIFLMGLHALPELAEELIRAGKDPAVPAAVLSGGNAPHPMAVRAPLSELPARAAAAGIQPPAVTVIGPVAALALTGNRSGLPLDGRTVALTGTDALARELTPALLSLGASVFRAQRSAIEPVETAFPWQTLADGQERWLVLTSPNGVRMLWSHLREAEIDLRRLHRCRFAVVGPGTGKALAGYGIHPDLCPEIYTTAALGEALLETVPAGIPVLLLRSAHASSGLRQMLAGRFPVKELPLYRLRDDPQTAAHAAGRLAEADFLLFASASGVELFFSHHSEVPDRVRCICIGPVTGEAFARRCAAPFLLAPRCDREGLLSSLLQAAREQG